MSEKKVPCNFDEIVPGSGGLNHCTPDVEEEFRGIRINAPREVFFGPGTEDLLFGGFAKIIVAGYCKLEYQTLGLRGRWKEAILLVAVDTRNRQVFTGTMQPFGSPAQPTDPLKGTDLTPEDYAGAVIA